MALDASKLERIGGGANGLFLYTTADSISTVTASGYFNGVSQMLRQYDRINVVSSTGGTPSIDGVFVTSATGSATVTTSATEGVTAT